MSTWAEAAAAKARAAMPRLQRELDAARCDLAELRERQAAVERAVTGLGPDADPDVTMAIRVASELLPPVVAEAETSVVAATTARREARAVLLPETESPWSRVAAARQADFRRSEELSRAQLHLGQLQRGRAMALVTTREAGPGSDMVALAAAGAELQLTDRALPAAREALAAAEAAAGEARGEVDVTQTRIHVLRGQVLAAEPAEAEAALVELLDLVGPDRSGLVLR